jgi:two-component system, NarL family, sensor histidine kinase DesK
VTDRAGAMGTTDTVVPMARPELPAAASFPTAPSGQARGRLRWIFAGVWLVYLVPVLQEAWKQPRAVERLVGVAAVLAFGFAYVWSFAVLSRWRRQGWGVTRAWRAGVLAVSVALFAVTAVVVGEEALGMLVFLAVQSVFLLPGRAGPVGAALCVAVEEVLARVVPGWVPAEGLGFAIALAAIAMWGVTGMIQRNVELARAQETIAELAVQGERSRFARDLHDILGHSLTVLTVKAELAGRLVSIDPQRAEREIGEVEQLARQALTDVRAAVSGYREVSLPGELASARAALEAAGIVPELPGAVEHVPPARRELIAWTVREGVTNAVRHSGARHVWVRVTDDGVEVADDGRGPADGADDFPATGHGLAGLRERAAAVGAAVTVGRRDGGGFALRVHW